MEFVTVTRDEDGNVVYQVLPKDQVQALLDEAKEKGMLVSQDVASTPAPAGASS